VFGDNWPEIDGVVSHPAVNGQAYLDIMYRSKVNLNILRNQNVGSNNMRTFEIPATRGFMMHEYSEEAMSFFEMGKEADYYRTPEECAEKIGLYLRNESQRIAIAEAAHKKIYDSGYLYENLMEGLLSKLDVRGV
jgi:spore maturation protein CgeB